ncbi:hypothetical protein [Runella slithyformis]|uniref:Type VI secretion system contractile sheath small subunit n=1 Tax=Runella slithyformis (strain ATCC 29530 / DSM 19594 / LMG 11500 / NCIMB 11436 / LSU 4) TaxID=761193 RepID=A0A7U4E8A8_RUNSL|nr:hypothetical protein [Runella slithyformis]AEI51513.1 hypothetical protein Runsl_5213 [Runella slithyformis DSM 19594]
MAIEKPQLGGVVIDEGTSEAIKLLHDNKTAIISKFTADSLSQEPVEGIQKLQDAFDHFQPQVDISHTTEEGQEVNETLNFTNMTAFTVKGMIEQSGYLQELKGKEDDYQTLIKRLMTNKVFQKLLADPAGKAAFVEALNAMIAELDEVDGE